MSQGAEKTRSTGYRMQISGLPQRFDREKLESLLSKFGSFQISETREESNFVTAVVQYGTKDDAERAANALNEYSFDGVPLSTRLTDRKSPRRTTGVPGASSQQQQRPVDFPLRILVQSDMVGAIIGRGGQTIRQITQQTRARVDVHRKDNVGSVEKAITIYGQPENCTNACHQIMKVITEEAKSTGKTEEMPLKILAHNNLIGRIIGKQGATIKRIMDETDTKITVSSINEINSFNVERIITIRGGLDEISKAEAEISSKLRTAYESDVQAMVVNYSAYNAIGLPGYANPTAPVGLNCGVVNTGQSLFSVPHYAASGVGNTSMTNSAATAASQVPETAYIYIPNTSVGAMIGSKGSHIRSIIQYSGANIKIAQEPEETTPVNANPERKMTVYGIPEAQWKAQYLIFEKIREEGYSNGLDVRLTVEIMVPTSQVGRIIGKGGSNVKDLQRSTNAIIKLPEQQGSPTGDETPVHINGIFYSVQYAQRRVRAMIQPPVANGNGPHRYAGASLDYGI